MDLAWWITGIAVPLVAALIAGLVSVHRSADRECANLHARINMLTGQFSEYKVQVAREFATRETLQRVEDRLGQALVRIEDKLNSLNEHRHQGGRQ